MQQGAVESQIKLPSIMIVEDHDVLRKSLVDWLTSNYPGACISEAKNGEEAVSMAFERNPDVILMDITMPGMNGLDATQRIKKELSDTEVVILSIHESSEYRSKAEEAGASAYVQKRKMISELIPVLSTLKFNTVAKKPQNGK